MRIPKTKQDRTRPGPEDGFYSNFLDMELDKILMKLSPGNQIRYKFSVEGLSILIFTAYIKEKIRRAK
jgi:hypothetical protein